MSNKLIIGITQRVNKTESYDESRDALDQRLIDWVVEAGFIPIPIPNTLINLDSSINNQPTLDNWIQTLQIDAIILSGGNNIGEIPKRDLTENFLLSWSEKNKKPVFGICRGMQMMGVYAGGKLIEVDGHVKTLHHLQVVGNNKQIFPKLVNSYHNQALYECPSAFNVLAKSEDGSIEAMVHKSLPWEAWMWHPEREVVFFKNDIDRFKKIILNEKR
jgi:N5-(cytidine 5'-diphosphoramidyl)-L-glutamine hydrolase